MRLYHAVGIAVFGFLIPVSVLLFPFLFHGVLTDNCVQRRIGN